MAALRTNGPVTAGELWNAIRDPRYATALEEHGLTPSRVSAVTEAVATLDARVVLHDGKVSFEMRAPGQSRPRRLSLRPSAERPRGIGDLLRRSQFEQVVSAFENDRPAYMEAMAPGVGPLDCEPSELCAFAAVVARQQMTEHVRKLEDTGLATYEGNEPTSSLMIGLIIAGFLLTGLGAFIMYVCNHPEKFVGQPDYVCTAGYFLMLLGVLLLMAGGIGAILLGYSGGSVGVLLVGALAEGFYPFLLLMFFELAYGRLNPASSP
jgi:hypothetical protein